MRRKINRLLITSAAGLFSLFFLSCNALQKLGDRATGFYRRGSCVSVDIPPITLTPSRTAAERQLIGDSSSIEENGWVIASAKNVIRNEDNSDGEVEEARRLYRERSVLNFYDPSVNELRLAGILGESHDGKLRLVPETLTPRIGKYRDPFEIRNATFIADEVNRSRLWIYEYMLKQEAKKSRSSPKAIREEYLQIYSRNVHTGEWFWSAKGKWERIR